MALADHDPRPGSSSARIGGGRISPPACSSTSSPIEPSPARNRPGRCLDNAVAESFFHTLNSQLVYQHRYRTREEARLAIFEYIAAFHNRTRRHSNNGYRSPDEHEAHYAVSRT